MKKLKLKKELIANLSKKEQSSIKGGFSLLTFCVACRTIQTGAGCYPEDEGPYPSGGADGACSVNTCQP
ncbi:MAG: class I lanthipeptide [Thiohalospira sp.]